MPCNSYQGPYASQEEEDRIHAERRQKILDDATRAACTLGKILHGFVISIEDADHANNWFKQHCIEDEMRNKDKQ